MKELSIEEKAARYDKAINIARKINSGEGVAAPSGWTTCEVIFPELKESEDEKIRKTLIRVLNENVGNGIEKYGAKLEDALAWLEKQGEQKPAEEYNITGISSKKSQGKLGEIIKNLKTTWGEDYINDLIKYFSQNERLKNTKEDIVIWLKSLKSQKQWKPSDAQMDSITCAVRKMKESACYDSELVSLHQDLKKLK